MTVDLTFVLTAHDETVVAGPSVRAADQAVATARARGYAVEQVIALDRAVPATIEYFRQSHFDHWVRWSFGEGDAGRARNAAVHRAGGRYVGFLDAGDLVSENWLAEALVTLDDAAGRGEKAVAHPELTVRFDGARAVVAHIEQESALFTPHFLYVGSYYDSLRVAPREAYLEVPYPDDSGTQDELSSQDRQVDVGTMARGWKHVVCRDTIVFKRHHDSGPAAGRAEQRPMGRHLPEMAIDRIRDLHRPAAGP